MKPLLRMTLPLLVSVSLLDAQESAHLDRAKFAEEIRSHYYNLRAAGFVSFTCNVKFDLDTVPKAFLLPAEAAGRKPLEDTSFKAVMDLSDHPTLHHELPKSAPALMIPLYDRFFDLLSSFTSGFLQTWGDKGLETPIHLGTVFSDVETLKDGYKTGLNIPGARIEWQVGSDYAVKELVTKSTGSEIDEHPVFTPSPAGFLYTGVEATSHQGESTTHVRYDLDYQVIDTLQLPHRVHMIVDTSDLRFSFENCTVTRGKILTVGAPPILK